ncbi:ABC transporter ATP-binding protein [Bradyrhizobium sp. 166]|uniref:ATP-binding cassette domain-containing protein n=1 Tax=Bradyrhizobium sp. 166 TaxID=2782638 RepID=UPI001FFA701D|nr:ABC transporter ATP-binding protein [Bradyrhizobium sp. 166]MCK1604788.1 ABC transporter ATP-binding protein [Bradyrhizobium sp. 166]
MSKIDVSLKGVRKEYGSHVVVEEFSIDTSHGEIVCLLGPSGCGKTTTLRMVAGFISADGRLYLHRRRRRHKAPPYRRNTGMVFQAYALFPHRNVEQNIAFGLECRKLPTDVRRQRVGELLELIEMAHLRQGLPKEYREASSNELPLRAL